MFLTMVWHWAQGIWVLRLLKNPNSKLEVIGPRQEVMSDSFMARAIELFA